MSKKISPAQQSVIDMIAGNYEVVATRLTGGSVWSGHAYHFATNEKISMATLNSLVSRGLIICDEVKSTRRVYRLAN